MKRGVGTGGARAELTTALAIPRVRARNLFPKEGGLEQRRGIAQGRRPQVPTLQLAALPGPPGSPTSAERTESSAGDGGRRQVPQGSRAQRHGPGGWAGLQPLAQALEHHPAGAGQALATGGPTPIPARMAAQHGSGQH